MTFPAGAQSISSTADFLECFDDDARVLLALLPKCVEPTGDYRRIAWVGRYVAVFRMA